MKATRYITYLNGAAVLLICLFGREILHYWMGPDFSAAAYWVMVFISIALFFDSISTLPSLVNDAFGKPRNTGVFAILRAGVAVALTFLFVPSQSISVVASAQTIAAVVMVLTFVVFIHRRSLPWTVTEVFQEGWLIPFSVLTTITVVVATARPSGVLSVLEMSLGLTVSALFLASAGAIFVLEREDRIAIMRWLRGLRRNAIGHRHLP